MGELEIERTTDLVARLQEGDPQAKDQLLSLLYEELKRLAQHFLNHERPDHTLQATALVHEAYLRLLGQDRCEVTGKSHFLALAARMIRRVLIDHARAQTARKRGGDFQRLSLHDHVQLAHGDARPIDVLQLHELLEQFESQHARQAQVVEMRFFAGLSVEETAAALGVSPRTVKNDWKFARAWFQAKLSEDTLP